MKAICILKLWYTFLHKIKFISLTQSSIGNIYTVNITIFQEFMYTKFKLKTSLKALLIYLAVSTGFCNMNLWPSIKLEVQKISIMKKRGHTSSTSWSLDFSCKFSFSNSCSLSPRALAIVSCSSSMAFVSINMILSSLNS